MANSEEVPSTKTDGDIPCGGAKDFLEEKQAPRMVTESSLSHLVDRPRKLRKLPRVVLASD